MCAAPAAAPAEWQARSQLTTEALEKARSENNENFETSTASPPDLAINNLATSTLQANNHPAEPPFSSEKGDKLTVRLNKFDTLLERLKREANPQTGTLDGKHSYQLVEACKKLLTKTDELTAICHISRAAELFLRARHSLLNAQIQAAQIQADPSYAEELMQDEATEVMQDEATEVIELLDKLKANIAKKNLLIELLGKLNGNKSDAELLIELLGKLKVNADGNESGAAPLIELLDRLKADTNKRRGDAELFIKLLDKCKKALEPETDT